MKRTVLVATVLALAACSDKATIATAAAETPKMIAAPTATVTEPVKPAAEPDKPNPNKELGLRVARAMEDAKLQGIDIAVADGVVTLWGAVPSDSERRRAAQVVAKVEGVKAVENKLAVVAGS